MTTPRRSFASRLLAFLALLLPAAVLLGAPPPDPHDHLGTASPALPAPAAGGKTLDGLPVIDVPNPDVGADTLAARGAAEKATVAQFKVFHDFQFTDRLPESGITFVHGIVDDAG